MSKKKITKGQYGYIKNQKVWVSAKTFLLYAMSLAIFGIGIKVMGTKENLLTVIAILGCLPAGRSTVNMIMFLKASGCSMEAKDKIGGYTDGLTEIYDMFFTSYERNYPVSHMVLQSNVVCGYSESRKMDTGACGKHLEAYLKQGGCSGVAVKIYNDIEKYCEGLKNLQKQKESTPKTKEDGDREEIILENLLSISL